MARLFCSKCNGEGSLYGYGTLLEAATQLDALLKERDALQARVKELEADFLAVSKWHSEAVEENDELQSRATRAEQERDEALERLKPFARAFELNDCDNREDDDALEVSIKDLRAARDCVRRLESGPDKEKK